VLLCAAVVDAIDAIIDWRTAVQALLRVV